jgi:hypothetical protein
MLEVSNRVIAARQPDRARDAMANHLDRVAGELHAFVVRHRILRGIERLCGRRSRT